jgi:hypothetical protein
MAKPNRDNMKPPDVSFLLDPGPTATISATVPKNILQQVRETVGNRGLSAFVTKALRRELIRMNRARYIAMVEAESGPLPEALLAEARRMLSQ